MPGHLEVRHLDGTGDWADASRIFRGEDCHYARQLAGSIGANGLNFGVRVRRASESAMKHTRKFQVVGVVADALDKAWVFLTLQFLAEPANVAVALASITRCPVRFYVTRHGSPRS